jgi:hypothetical protein
VCVVVGGCEDAWSSLSAAEGSLGVRSAESGATEGIGSSGGAIAA